HQPRQDQRPARPVRSAPTAHPRPERRPCPRRRLAPAHIESHRETRRQPMGKEHTLDAGYIHHNWDNSREPALVVASGDVVHLQLPVTGDGQVNESSTVEDVHWDFDTIYNLAGPLFVQGAQPGDPLAIEVLELQPGSWGWTTMIPELGLLPDDFPDPYLKIFDLRGGNKAAVSPGIEVPIAPFLGTM